MSSTVGNLPKYAAGALVTLLGFKWLNDKILLSEDLSFGVTVAPLLRFAKSKAGTDYTVADRWNETLATVSPKKACLINATDGETFTFEQVENTSNQVHSVSVCGYG